MSETHTYPPIADYAYLADCHSAALVSKSGSIDWCCMPRVDSPSCFGRLLDWARGGYCSLAPTSPYQVSREYLRDTLVLKTTFYTASGSASLLDCFSMREEGEHHPHQQILRVVEGLKGSVDFGLEIVPRFDYGAIKPWIRRYRQEGQYMAIGGSDGLLISGDLCIDMKSRHELTGSCSVRGGERRYLSIVYRKPEDLDEGFVDVPQTEQLGRRVNETIQWWRSWCSQGEISGPYADLIQRSAVVLKGLSNAPTGAFVAAATTSLPESAGGSRNWDYRFSWIRDSSFAVRSLGELGYDKEADGFRRFVERSAGGSADELQTLFGLGGERRLHELELDGLEGYRRARPVRIGNAAEGQKQHDLYGQLLDLAWRWHRRNAHPDDDYWEFLMQLVAAASRLWDRPDRGIWEMRGRPRHFVQSKVMCWAALNYGIRLAEALNRDAPLEEWKKTRSDIRQAVETRGYDAERGIFIQAFEHPTTDAALLLVPEVGFLAYDDERMIRTTDAIRQDLEKDGLLRRYEDGNDEMPGTEGVFLPCSFWLVECLARQGRFEEARRIFKRCLSTGNDLGLFSEEYDTEADEMLGNYPQALTHFSLIAAALALQAGAAGGGR
jgi:pentatricopeptide repeat protein